MAPLTLSTHIEQWALKSTFRISGYSWSSYGVNVVQISDGTHVGHAESTPVHFLNETTESAQSQIEAVAQSFECGTDRERLHELMPPGSARNAVDCALWDLEAKRCGKRIWELVGIDPRPLATAFTIGIEDSPEAMAGRAREAAAFSILKIKLDKDRPVERVSAIRAARPEARLTVDANQAWTFDELREFAPRLADLGVRLIEQPLPRGADAELEEYKSPIPLCADESCQHRGHLGIAADRYQIINIKLDKAGGLTEALLLAKAIRRKDREVLVSCMGGTSLGMAPGFVVAQLADYVELDGHTLLRSDRFPQLRYENGKLAVLDCRLWG
jgi:L-alanine-DL-glutamate epimerase-like enolase superfamily enzyme